jgi:hypothetical protein
MIPKYPQIETEGPDVHLGEMTGPGKASVSKKPAGFIGGAASRMQALASFGNEMEGAVAKVAGKPARRVDTKGGRRAIAGDLGLPNTKKRRSGK